MKYRMLALAAVAAIAPDTARSQNSTEMRHSCEHFRTIEGFVNLEQWQSSELERRIRRETRGDVQVSLQEFTTEPPRFDCKISLIYKYSSPLAGTLEAIGARIEEKTAVQKVFIEYIKALRTAMQRNACGRIGYQVQDGFRGIPPGIDGENFSINTMIVFDKYGSLYGEVFYNTQTCTKFPWWEYHP